MRRRNWITALLAAALGVGVASPALAGTGPRSDITQGHWAVGFDKSAFSLDFGLNDHLTVGVGARAEDVGTAWSGVGAHATYRLIGKHDGWNLALGGRMSVPMDQYAALADSRVRDVTGAVGYMGAASGYVLLSMPLTSWFVLRYPVGLTYYLGAGQNNGTPWAFGSDSWRPDDGRTGSITTPGSTFYFPALQFLPEAAFKLWGFEATLFGTSIAGIRLTF
ncbi:hypothetical protein J7643_16040 [bacterium]|nr:hypothetical protein [bacterium]